MTTQHTPTGDRNTGEPPERWVVGVDGSPGARAALVWALGAAARSGARLELVSSYPVDFYWTDPYLVDIRRLDDVRADTARLVGEALAEARKDPVVAAVPGAGEVATEITVGGGSAAEHLVAAAEGAQRLVVGSRGRSGVRSTLLGSVALHCAAHAPCPVVVVHPGAVQPPPRVVVGVDDSAMSRAALRRAAEEARRMGADLEVVSAVPLEVAWSDVYSVVTPPTEETRARAREGAEALVAEVLGAGAPARVRVEEGAAAEALPRVAAGAELLVVGSHSHSRLAGMLLGSVALHCAVHAPCPVMIVHPEPTRAPDQPVGEPVAAAAR